MLIPIFDHLKEERRAISPARYAVPLFYDLDPCSIVGSAGPGLRRGEGVNIVTPAFQFKKLLGIRPQLVHIGGLCHNGQAGGLLCGAQDVKSVLVGGKHPNKWWLF